MKILNKKGSALLWAVCAVTVLTLVVAGILTFGSAYYKRVLREASREQALLYARSSIEYVQNEIVNNANTELTPVSSAYPITVTIPYSPGECVVTVEKDSFYKIRLTAVATSGAAEATLGALIEIDDYDVMTFLGYVNE